MGSRDLEARGVERPVARHESTRIPEDLKIPGTPRHRYESTRIPEDLKIPGTPRHRYLDIVKLPVVPTDIYTYVRSKYYKLTDTVKF